MQLEQREARRPDLLERGEELERVRGAFEWVHAGHSDRGHKVRDGELKHGGEERVARQRAQVRLSERCP